MMKVTGLGQCCLDRLGVVDPCPQVNEKAEVLLWEEQSGGPSATAMVTLSKLGIPSAFHGIVGNDVEGDNIRRMLTEAGVDIQGLIVRPGTRSQTAFIAIEKKTGRRTIFWRRAEGEELHPQDLPSDFPEGSDFLHLDGLMEEVSLYAAKKAREKGIPVMLDAGRIRGKTLEIARHCDYLVGSELFARQVGWGSPQFKNTVLDLGVKGATFTLGERGSFTLTQTESFETPAFRVNVVDTTGAGDVFHGAYIYGLLQKWDLRQVVRFASAAAAIKCTRIGGCAGLPTAEEALRLANR